MTTCEYPCPECGHDGPHRMVEVTDESGGRHEVLECVGCYVEFDTSGSPLIWD